MPKPKILPAEFTGDDGWVFLYARLSMDQKKKKTRDGKSRERENIESQFSRLHAECDRRGTPRDRRIEFADNDVSASKFSTKEREDYARLLTFIERSQGCTVMAVEQSRLVRREAEGYEFKELMLAHKMRLALLTGDIDLTSESGDLAWTFALFRDRSESAAISRRSRAKEATDRETLGIHRVSRIPFGYADQECRSIVPEQREMLHKMRNHLMRTAVVDGTVKHTGTIGECHRMLMNAGFLSPVTGKPFTRQAVKSMMLNPTYAGWVHHQGEKVRKSTHIKPIFTDAQFDALQERMQEITAEAMRKRGGKPITTSRVHVLSGFLRCGVPGCGAVMEIGSERRGIALWRCKQGGHLSRRYSTVAEAVDLWVAAWFSRARVRAVQATETDPRAVELDTKIETLQGRMQALVARYADPSSPIDDHEYFAMSAALSDSLTALRSERAAMERRAVRSVPVDGLDVWRDDRPENLDKRRALLDELIEHVIILPVGNANGPRPAPLSSVQVYPRRDVGTAEVSTQADSQGSTERLAG